ncbi:hypothetical protein PoB_002307200 [Plakobranchus ocellatus]|uniref:Uncharacterized protein n=1 Tax=Plakobranchus ocellatus TaxID=259542 RepID=A0AAV3ZPH5_9GAST|nr:hypothetical protein PoB_002307200 [Plakobranchus ocellatus]
MVCRGCESAFYDQAKRRPKAMRSSSLFFVLLTCPLHGLMDYPGLSGPVSSQGVSHKLARDKKVPADFKEGSLASVPLKSPKITKL